VRLGKIPEGVDDAYTKPRARLKVLVRSLNARLRETLESLQEARRERGASYTRHFSAQREHFCGTSVVPVTQNGSS